MKSAELRQKFLDFFEKRGHKIVPSSSLLPTDPSVLFTTAGMQQFKPYYLGEKSPWGKNVVSCQKCIRTSDIEEVGDERHLTFFEMLGNFSFGGYWKKEAIQYAYDFIVGELGLKIDYVTVFEGEAGVPEDKKSEEIWKNIDKDIVVKKFGRADNFWGPTGEEGPCGPTTEIYVNGIEIWNIVFNEFYQEKDKTLKPLEIKGIDTGMGLERLAMVCQNVPTVFETDLFESLMSLISISFEERKKRIIADHVRAVTFLISDGILPSNKDQGYIPRRLMRIVASYKNIDVEDLVEIIINKFGNQYANLNKEKVISEFGKERRGYELAYQKAKEIIVTEYKEEDEELPGAAAFGISSTIGIRLPDIDQIISDTSTDVSFNFHKDFELASKKHQELSRTASAGMFKGGLADHKPETIKLHTAHHLLLAALQEMFGKEVKQRGSNINSERLRLDFSFDRKLTDVEKQKLQDMVQSKIDQSLDVIKREMPLGQAKKIGAEMEFGVKYGNTVSVYFIVPMPEASKIRDGEAIGKDIMDKVISKEFCGGPHVKNTSELGKFKIIKEEASSQGVRRIKAILEP